MRAQRRAWIDHAAARSSATWRGALAQECERLRNVVRMLDSNALVWTDAYRPDLDGLEYVRGLANSAGPPRVTEQTTVALHACYRLVHMLTTPAGEGTAWAERQHFARAARETAVSGFAAVVLACECLNEAAGFPAAGPARPFDEECAS